jgi:hypothetical protein
MQPRCAILVKLAEQADEEFALDGTLSLSGFLHGPNLDGEFRGVVAVVFLPVSKVSLL